MSFCQPKLCKHTNAYIQALVIGNKDAHEEFTREIKKITNIAPAIWRAVYEL
jgi:hypothetical protein